MIKCDDVSFSYSGCNDLMTRKALSHVSLEIEKGTFVLLCGASGCGKTTLTRLLNGLIPHYYEGTFTGHVSIDDEAYGKLSLFDLSKKIGSVFQNPRAQFFNVETTSEIAFGAENHGLEKSVILDRVDEVVEDLKIDRLLGKSIFSLSGGEKQKIACGSAAAMAPEVYVLDEPSSNLDAAAIEDLKELLVTLKKQGKTVIISEHRLYYLYDLIDEVVYMKDGKITGCYDFEIFKTISNKTRIEMGLRSLEQKQLFAMSAKMMQDCDEFWTLKDFYFSYSKNTVALEIASDRIAAQKITAIIGNNGSGKTTFLRCLCGLEKKSRGTIIKNQKKYSGKDRLKLCYMVMQDVNHQLFTESVLDEVLISMEREDITRARDLLKELNLLDFEKNHPMGLSGGQKQRVAIASAVASERPILLFDEPTSGLDLFHMKQVATILNDLSRRGKTIVLVTHDLEFILRCCDEVIHMENGLIINKYCLNTDRGRNHLLHFFAKGDDNNE